MDEHHLPDRRRAPGDGAPEDRHDAEGEKPPEPARGAGLTSTGGIEILGKSSSTLEHDQARRDPGLYA
jgi:hypothetical protein